MKWEDNPLLWEKLDDLMTNTALETKELLDVLYEHRDEFNPMLHGLLFGAYGQLVMSYNIARKESNNPKLSLAIGLEKVLENPHFGALMKANMQNVVDEVVTKME